MKNKMGHQKHTVLNRPAYGHFGRQELAIIGTPCSNIQQLSAMLIKQLSPTWRIAYVDADHSAADGKATAGMLGQGALLEYTDKINFHRLDFRGPADSFRMRNYFNTADLVLVNGNHFRARRQIVVLDPRKESSLMNKLDRLDNVALLLQEGEAPVPEFLKQALPDWAKLPLFSTAAVEKITEWVKKDLENALAPLNGLVLAGGKSERMGQDKGLLNYHGMPQREYLQQLLAVRCENSYLSFRPEQLSQEDLTASSLLSDSFTGLGPYGAILSAFRKQPNHAWLVVACDLPLLDGSTLDHLIKNRNPSKIATAIYNPSTDFPEPLITIWEPKAYPVLLQFLAQGYSCPRKVLINSDLELIRLPDPTVLKNVNDPHQYQEVRALLNKRKLKR